jgi:uncharacterized protein (DUF488 family)
MPPVLSTIGYEDAPQAQVIERLKGAGVKVVIDVRAVASSRRAGFSKTLLAASLAEAGIEYLHLKQLGTPKEGRQAARAGHVNEMHRIFEAHMEEPAAQLQFAQAADIAGDRPAALLCYETDAACCHRRILSDRLMEALGCKVQDL